ncbi:MAG: ACP phosphodiesterase [Bacteroidales bacterium]|nr:ACP phosphodiesterase [Bacteroidales bacterium]
MNFLAHLYLSGDNDSIIIGNFIADHVKGNGINKFDTGIRNGILLHRNIDQFTDSHPQFILSKNRLVPNYRKYAGVIVDMYYDHFLSAFWQHYSDEPIEKFTRRMYRILLKRFLILPPKTKRILPFMAKDNWLVGYGKLEGLGRALAGMAYRTPFNSGMENAIRDLQDNYSLFKQEFEAFFPEIIEYANKQKAILLE